MAGGDKPRDVVRDRLGQMNGVHGVEKTLQLFGREMPCRRGRFAAPPLRDDLRENGCVNACDFQFEKETVQLGFRNRIGAFQFDRILRCEHEEGERQLACLALQRDASLLHGLQHGGLRLRRRAVDFIRQNDVGENRAWLEDEFAPSVRRDLQDIAAKDVRRQ